MSNVLKSSDIPSKASSYRKSCQLVPEESAFLGYVIFKSDSGEFLFSWRKTAFSNICDWVKVPSVAQLYNSADLASQTASCLPGSELMRLNVCRLYKVNSEFVVI